MTTSSGRRRRAGGVRPRGLQDRVWAARPGQGVPALLALPGQPLVHVAGICPRPKVGVGLASRRGAGGTGPQGRPPLGVGEAARGKF